MVCTETQATKKRLQNDAQFINKVTYNTKNFKYRSSQGQGET